MASGIIVILAALIPFFLNLITARMTPAAKQEDENETLEKDIAAGRTDSINILLHDKLQDTGGSNSSRPVGQV